MTYWVVRTKVIERDEKHKYAASSGHPTCAMTFDASAAWIFHRYLDAQDARNQFDRWWPGRFDIFGRVEARRSSYFVAIPQPPAPNDFTGF